jgi:hypothetical protein
MAICKFGSTVVGLRGTVGGMTFSAGKAGPYVRTWNKGSNPRSERQTAARSNLSDQAKLWASLSPGDQLLWRTWAALPAQEKRNSLGMPYYLSGYQWFTALNTRLMNAQASQITLPPTTPVPSQPSGISINYSSGGMLFIYRVSWPAGMFGSNAICVESSPSIASQKVAQYTGFRMLTSTFAIGGLTALDVWIEHLEVFGQPFAGWRMFTRISAMNSTGQRSTSFDTYTDFVP